MSKTKSFILQAVAEVGGTDSCRLTLDARYGMDEPTRRWGIGARRGMLEGADTS